MQSAELRGRIGQRLAVIGLAMPLLAVGFSANRATAQQPSGNDVAAKASETVVQAYQGYGASTRGGAEGETVAVTTLADSGAGSLREALQGGNRKLVFKVGGTIKLKTQLEVKGSRVTIAGETAPAPGITLQDQGLFIGKGNDIIVRHLRFRKGLNSNLRIQGRSTHHVVVDHCSFSKGNDRNLIVNSGPRDVTVSWCLFADCNKGMLLYDASGLSIHHCLFTNHHQRNPQFTNYKNVDICNNYIRNWGYYGIRAKAGATGNIVDNVIGSVEHAEKQPGNALLVIDTSGPVYVSGNQGPNKTEINKKGRSPKPLDAPKVDTVPAAQVAEMVMKGVGARPLDETDQKYLKDTPELRPSLKPRPGKVKG